jgi:hypothetical protein
MSDQLHYIIEQPPMRREAVATRHLLEVEGIADALFSDLGLRCPFAWFVIELGTEKLSEARGEIDIVAGALSWACPEKFEELFEANSGCMPRGTRHGTHSWQPSRWPNTAVFNGRQLRII